MKWSVITRTFFTMRGGLVQLHCGLDTGVVEMHKLQQSIRSNWTEGSPWHLSLERLAAQASPHYSSAILSHHGPPEPLLHEGKGPLLSLVASIPIHPVKRHVVLSCGDDEWQYSLSLAFWGRVDVHQTPIQDETVVDAEEHLALLHLGFWWHTLPEAKPLAACS